MAAAAVKSAMDQRVLTGAFDDLAAKAAATAAATAPSAGSSSDASAAEAALLEAWRTRQLSSDRAEDEVELGPMIGRGGFGQVLLRLAALHSFKCTVPCCRVSIDRQDNASHPDVMLQVHKARWRGALVSPHVECSLSHRQLSCLICRVQGTCSCKRCASESEVGTKVARSCRAAGCREDCEPREERSREGSAGHPGTAQDAVQHSAAAPQHRGGACHPLLSDNVVVVRATLSSLTALLHSLHIATCLGCRMSGPTPLQPLLLLLPLLLAW